MELQTAEMERQANSGMVSKVEGVTDAIGDIDGIDEVGGGVIQNLDGALNTGANAILSGKETAEAIVETMSMEDPITKESEARRESVGDMIRSAIHNASGFAIGAKDAVE